jgi:hypothetical protein
VTGEGKKDTEPWIESKGAKYAYAYDKGGAFARWFGVGGIPTRSSSIRRARSCGAATR